VKKKQISILVFLLFIGTFNVRAQINVNYQDLGLFKKGNNAVGLFLGQPPTKAIEVFGIPTNVEDEYLEIDDVTAKVLYYGKNRLVFTDNSLTSFVIYQSNILMGKTDWQQFRVGDKFPTKKKILGNPHNFRLSAVEGTFDGLSFKAYILGKIINKGSNMEKSLAMYFNANGMLLRVYVLEL
jgi:hypothetical protein